MKPLADAIRPQTLEEFVGQKHLVGKDGLIRKLLQTKPTPFPSLIFWGPAGSGKTTLARIIAQKLNTRFIELSAVTAKKTELEKIFASSPQNLFSAPPPSSPPLLFLDEIHRFSKAQQDVLLNPVESGRVSLIAATTENPSFYIIAPLLSRCQTLIFHPLEKEEMKKILLRGIRYLSRKIEEKAEELILQASRGDARVALNLLEQAARSGPTPAVIPPTTVAKIISATPLRYDKKGEEHYNTISAFIKSMRASDPDAAVYYLARMLEAGEDPLFLARRMVIFASEDIGLADPQALPLATAVFHACQEVGLPEAEINLAHGAVYLTQAPKSRASYDALRAAQKDVKKYGHLEIPLKLRNPETKLMKEIGYGKGYEKYPDQKESFLPKKLKGRKYYR